MSEQITKIKVNNDQTAIVYYKNSNNIDSTETVFKGGEKITEEFYNVFQNAVKTFLEIVPALQNDEQKIKMQSIAFEYEGLGDDKRIDKVSYIINYTPQKGIKTEIPIKNVSTYKENSKDFTVSGKDVLLLHSILDCANKYILGDTRTKQMKLEVVQ